MADDYHYNVLGPRTRLDSQPALHVHAMVLRVLVGTLALQFPLESYSSGVRDLLR